MCLGRDYLYLEIFIIFCNYGGAGEHMFSIVSTINIQYSVNNSSELHTIQKFGVCNFLHKNAYFQEEFSPMQHLLDQNYSKTAIL